MFPLIELFNRVMSCILAFVRWFIRVRCGCANLFCLNVTISHVSVGVYLLVVQTQ